MRKCLLVASMALLGCALTSCSSPGYHMYRQNLFKGGQSLRDGDLQAALPAFLAAHQDDPSEPLPLALAGQVAYRTGDYAGAHRYLSQASGLNPTVKGYGRSYVIIKGYEALLAFRENRRTEGMTALGEYIRVYGNTYPDSSYRELTNMYNSGTISIPALEGLINHQMERYEGELFEILF